MSYELAAILVVGVLMGLAQAAAIVTAVSGLGALAREMDRHLRRHGAKRTAASRRWTAASRDTG